MEIEIKKPYLPKDVFREDSASRADIAIVIGSSDPDHLRQRISTGVSLFTSGRTAKLILTGDGRQKSPDGRSEADRMKDYAVKVGVPATAIIVEDTSNEPIASAKECSRLLKTDVSLQAAKSAFLVSSAWHLLRLSIIMRRHLPRQLTIYCHPATEGITAANWVSTPQGRALVDNELRLIEKLLKTGY